MIVSYFLVFVLPEVVQNLKIELKIVKVIVIPLWPLSDSMKTQIKNHKEAL